MNGSPSIDVTAGGALFARLKTLGVDIVFVNSGTDFPPIIEGLAEAYAHEIDLPQAVLALHEHVAMGMAHGYYFATGQPAAVILHTNVGLANGAIGAINAAADHVPMILMSGRTPTVERDRFGARTVPIGWGQEMRDQTALVREASKWDYELRFPEQVPSLLDRAHAIATSTPKGPVYLSLPREVLAEQCPAAELQIAPAMAASVIEANTNQTAAAAELLAHAKRPVIFAQRGAGTHDGFDALARIADEWAIPVCQYWAVANAISAEHPMYVGIDPEPWISEADVVLVIDSLAPWSPDIHKPPTDCQVIQLGPNPLYSRFPVRNFPSALSITTETAAGIDALEHALMAHRYHGGDQAVRDARRAHVETYTSNRRAALDDGAQPDDGQQMTKAWVSHCVSKAITGHRATVISELGCPLEPLRLTEHDSWRQEPHSGGLGWGLPCALGMKLADPDRLVVATMGDGSYVFANPVACHRMAEAHGIAVLTVILNNTEYGAVRHGVTAMYPTGYAAKSEEMPLTSLAPSTDFSSVAEANRAYGERVDDAAALPAALERAMAVVLNEKRQVVLDVRVES